MPRLIEDDSRRMAVLLEDVNLLDAVMRCKLFGSTLCRLDVKGREVIEDSPALIFTCSLIQAALIIDLSRNYSRETGGKLMRCYLDKGRGWQRIPGKAVLTILLDGSTVLNPEVFGDKLEAPALQAESVL